MARPRLPNSCAATRHASALKLVDGLTTMLTGQRCPFNPTRPTSSANSHIQTVST